jgi:hypothetical protein
LHGRGGQSVGKNGGLYRGGEKGKIRIEATVSETLGKAYSGLAVVSALFSKNYLVRNLGDT